MDRSNSDRERGIGLRVHRHRKRQWNKFVRVMPFMMALGALGVFVVLLASCQP